MEDLFCGLDEIAGDGSFGSLNVNMVGLLECSTVVLAHSLNDHQEDTANQEILGAIATDMDELAQNSDGESTMTPEMVQAMKDVELEPDDVSDPKLKALLEGAYPETITFTDVEMAIKVEGQIAIEEGTQNNVECSVCETAQLTLNALERASIAREAVLNV